MDIKSDVVEIDEEDKDFGFTFTSEGDIAQDAVDIRLAMIMNLILPFLEKLKSNPEKDTIKWPGEQRVSQIEKFIAELQRLAKG
jgi:hypothetical protein